jgi:hypothetical protein
MSDTTPRKPFVDPQVSPPVDALDTTRVFGGLVGGIILAGSGTATDDGDVDCYGDACYGPDSPGQDGGVDPTGDSPPA